MSLTLSSTEIAQLAHAIHLLASPLDHESVDHWRSAVNRQLRELLHADSAGFLLPVEEGLMLYSEEHDAAELARYPDVVAPDLPDGTPMWEQVIRSGVDTLANIYGPAYDRYLGSAYYQEYAGANGAHDPLTAAVSLGGADARGMACLHFWHARPDGRLFGERELTLMRLMFPAFRAGVEAQVRWGSQREELLETLEDLEHATLVGDLVGDRLHLTRRLRELVAVDPEGETLLEEVQCVFQEVRRGVLAADCDALEPATALVREVATGTARYRICASLYGRRFHGRSTYVVVALERCTPRPRPAEELQRVFLLTPAEARVAILLAEGKPNAVIAEQLFISPHTARRHTERVMRKLDVHSRAEVAARVLV